MSPRNTVINAFLPSSFVDEPSFFAGRQDEIKELTNSLLSHGSCPIIFGDRGLGKSSLATQIARIAMGDVELLGLINAPDYQINENQRFTVFWVGCSDQLKSKNDIIRRMISVIHRTIKGFKVQTTTTKQKFSFKFYEEETSTTEVTQPEPEKDIEEEFLDSLQDAFSQDGTKALFIVDELDRVPDSSGLSNFIKNVSSDSVKFLLVGIANNISTLLADHESLERQIFPVRLKKMRRPELEEIVDKAEAFLNHNSLAIHFLPEAKKALCEASGGFPWFVHVIGQDSLIRAYDTSQKEISLEDINNSIERLSENRYSQNFSDCYQAAVRDSSPREVLIRLMAHWHGEDIPMSEVYRVARFLKVSNPSALKKQLMHKTFGASIISPPGHDRGVVRFKNSMFKRYINLRSSIYKGVKEAVESAWAQIIK